MTPSEGLRTVFSASFVFLWLLPGPDYYVNGAAGGKGKLGGSWKLNVCNEKVGFTCSWESLVGIIIEIME